MTPVIQYAGLDGVWRDYFLQSPPDASMEDVYLAVEKIIEQRPHFRYKVIWPQQKTPATLQLAQRQTK